MHIKGKIAQRMHEKVEMVSNAKKALQYRQDNSVYLIH